MVSSLLHISHIFKKQIKERATVYNGALREEVGRTKQLVHV
jgi:hypothetical protein